VGGHNLLEPAAWGKPVFFGPHTDHCAEIAAQLSRAGGGIRVQGGGDMAVQMARLLKDRSAARAVGDAARSVVEENRGALQRSLEEISRILDRVGSPSADSSASLAGAPRAEALAHTPVER